MNTCAVLISMLSGCLLQVQQLADAAAALLSGPRPSHADGGACVLALLLRKYVLGLGWQLEVAGAHKLQLGVPVQPATAQQNGRVHEQLPAAAEAADAHGGSKHAAGTAFLQQLCTMLQVLRSISESGCVRILYERWAACPVSIKSSVLLTNLLHAG